MSRFSCILAAAFAATAMAQGSVSYTPGQPIVVGGVTYVLVNGAFVAQTAVAPATFAPVTRTNAPAGVCADSTTFNVGYGGCATYGAGSTNAAFCTLDGADRSCPRACGKCPSVRCADSTTFDAGYGKCGTYAVGQANDGYCAIDAATSECKVSCKTCDVTAAPTARARTTVCQDSTTFTIGFGGCDTYKNGQENYSYCKLDGADIQCPVACNTCKDICLDNPTWSSQWGSCATYGVGLPNNKWCTSDGADTPCPLSCGKCTGAGTRPARPTSGTNTGIKCSMQSTCAELGAEGKTGDYYCSSCAKCVAKAAKNGQSPTTFCPGCSFMFQASYTTGMSGVGICTPAIYCPLDADSVDGNCPRTEAPTASPTQTQ